MKHKMFLGILLFEILLLSTLMVSASVSATRRTPNLMANQQLVKNLMLTDLSLWTEARYSRHPSQADFFAQFQDFPAAIERFPGGSFTAPAALDQLSRSAGSMAALSGQNAEAQANKKPPARQ